MPTLRILVVDDEEGMRLGVIRALGRHKFRFPDISEEVAFEVEAAETGEKALELVHQRAPDILLLDYKLPGISGLDVLEKVNPQETGMLIIMITAYASLETAVTAIKRGAYDFLAKPFTPDELRATVKKASESLILAREARRLAQEKRRVRFEFISVVAHELKAPLSAIEGYLQVIKNRCSGDSLDAYTHIIERCLIRGEYMRKMITDLLDLTRIESGQKKRQVTEVDVAEVARTVLETEAPEAAKRSISLNIKAAGPVKMMADRGEIEIILNNLVSNAVKYNRDNGRVDVALKRDGQTITISVADTGFGMSQEEAGRLFNEFVRLKSEKTRHILGSGLGLSIVKKLAVLYDGGATVESQPDVGSTFTVTLSASASDDTGHAP
jgi:signal transduction histidine kinase